MCLQWLHISQYSTRKLSSEADDNYLEDIWFEEDGKLYGKPQGYCKLCQSACVRGRKAVEERKAKVRAEQAGKPKAELTFAEEMDAMLREVPQAYLDAESERLERLYGPPE
jgi:hypothetical protein